MNCREFEDIANDLARAKMFDAESRAAGMAHVEICARCASRLADERVLSAGLKSLAASDEGKATPESVEAALLEAFRAQAANPIARPLPVRSRSWPRWAMAATAALLIVFGQVIYRAIQNELHKDNGVITEKTPTPQPSVKRDEQVANDAGKSEPRHRPRAPRHRRVIRPRLIKPFIIDSMTSYAKDSESSTDFLSLSYGGDQRPMESGKVIRVQIPHSALIAFGLPVNIEWADVPVKADLLIGEDGMARAIRFVR